MVAATGVGAADLVATLIAGSKYGYLLLWCAVLGCVMKIVLVEGAGRYSLATGRTIFEGWRSLGIWTTWYFAPYIVVWGFVYGAAAMAGTGLAAATRCSTVLGVTLVGHPLRADRPRAGLERPLRPLREGPAPSWSALMFVTMVGAAAVTLPNLPELLDRSGPADPRRRPDQRAQRSPAASAARSRWRRTATGCARRAGTPRRSCGSCGSTTAVAYLVTGMFVVATLIVGAELLYSANIAVSDR